METLDSERTAKLDTELVEIALFPIPGCVCFPYSPMPLHVFEPRYRNLVKDSVRLSRPIGVCHTQKVISPARPTHSAAEALNSNQATYDPQKVFSAGLGEIREVTEDGRLGVEILMDQRYEWVEDVQMLPYRIVRGRPLPDEPTAVGETSELRLEVEGQLNRLFGPTQPELSKLLASPAWTELTDEDFSFKIFGIVRFDPEILQTILEMRSAQERLQTLSTSLSENFDN